MVLYKMGNIPSQPPNLENGNIRPVASDETLEFYWGYPLPINIGLPPPVDSFTISTYSIFGGAAPISYTLNPSTFYLKISSLMNHTQYAFLMTASNEYGISDPAYFRTVQPGLPPNPITNPTVTVVSTSAVQVGWTAPIPDVNIPSTGWFVVESVSSSSIDPEVRVNTYGFESTVVISSLNTASMYSFNIYAVNDPGYSFAVSTLSISPTPIIGDLFTYIQVFLPEGSSTYSYHVYNTINQWGVVQSPYTVNDDDGAYSSSNYSNYYYYGGGTSNIFANGFYSRYPNPETGYNEHRYEFRNTDGSLLRTISTINNNEGWILLSAYGNSNTAYFYNSNDVTSNYDIQIYQPHTNTYQSSSIINTYNYNNDIELLNNGAYFITSNVYHYEHYIWNINSNAPTLITSTYLYNQQRLFGISSAIFLITYPVDLNYYNTATYVDDTGFVSNYSLASNTYTDTYLNQYGVYGDRVFFQGYDSITSSYDAYVFNQLPNMTPIIFSNLGYSLTYVSYSNQNNENYEQTYASDVLLLIDTLSTQGTSYYINRGGGPPYDKDLFVDNGGNYIDMKIRLEDGSIMMSNDQINYGRVAQRSNYGYLVGSLNAYPHTSLMYVTAGSNDISVRGSYKALNFDYISDKLFSTFTGSYTCANGTYGTYWVQQTGTNVPTSDIGPFGIDLWYSVEHSNWGSVLIDYLSSYSAEYSDYLYRNEVYGSNFILCKSLIGSISSIDSEWKGTFLDEASIVDFLQSYVNDAPFCDNNTEFSTINLKAFDEWNVSTGYVYYSTLLTTNFPYVYDGEIDTDAQLLREGTAYLISGSNASVVSTIFTNSNLFVNDWTIINSNAAAFIVQEQSNVMTYILTSNGVTSTFLSTLEAFYIDYEIYNDANNFSDLFYFNITSAINDESLLYILSNDGTLLTSNIINNNNIDTRFSGRNALIYENDTSNVNIVQNGILTSNINLPYGEWNTYDPYPDFANGQLAITSYDSNSDTIIVKVTNDAISTFSTSFFTTNNYGFLTQSFLIIIQTSPFKLLAHDMNTGAEYGYSTINNVSYTNILNQADSICIVMSYAYPTPNDNLVFNFSTTTFSIRTGYPVDIPDQFSEYTTSPYGYN